jgi:hypothetical protein
MTLTGQEAAYIRRYCYETYHNLFGPGTVFRQCLEHCQDLDYLAAATDIQGDVIRGIEAQEPPPPPTDFPWPTFADLHRRRLAMERTTSVR